MAIENSSNPSIQTLDSANWIRPYYFVNPNRQFLESSSALDQDLLNSESNKVQKKYRNLLVRSLARTDITGYIFNYNSAAFELDSRALDEEQPKLFETYLEILDTSRASNSLFAFHLGSDFLADSSYFKKNLSKITKRGIPFILLNEEILASDTDLRKIGEGFKFNGLFGVQSKNTKNLTELVQKGADLIVIDYHPETYKQLLSELNLGSIEKDKFSYSIKRNLLAKTWMRNGFLKEEFDTVPDSLQSPISDRIIKNLQYDLARNSAVLINNKVFGINNIKKGFDIYATDKYSRFQRVINQYSGFHPIGFKYTDIKLIQSIAKAKKKTILILDKIKLDTCKSDLIDALNQATQNKNVITVLVGNPSNILRMKEAKNLIYLSHFMDKNQYILAKQICGVLSFEGNLAFYHKEFGENPGTKISRTRMGKGKPEEVGINPDTLAQIDYLVRRALSGRAFPGCQVLVAKDGQIIYDKNFGYQTYRREHKISDKDVYDIASLTKVVATTMVAMKLYELKAYKLQDSLYRYLPEDTLKLHLRRRRSSIRNIRFDEILVHKSGLPAGAPIIQYLKYVDRQKEIGRYDKYYCDEKDDTIFCVEIANGYYLDGSYLDSMWLKMNSLYIDKSKAYKYSDVNMNLLYRMFKSIIAKKNLVRTPRKANYDVFTRFLDSCFYRPLEMRRTTYLPRMRYDTLDIVPTEDDKWWKKTIVERICP